MKDKIKFYWETLKETFSEWSKSQASKDASSLAYAAIFSIPGLLIIVIWIAGIFLGEDAIRGEISTQIQSVMGQDAAKELERIIASSMIDKDDIVMKTIGIASLVFGATTLFWRLQQSLNYLWRVETRPDRPFYTFLTDRASSLGLILIIGFLLIITMMLTTLISLLNNWITHYFGLETYELIQVVNFTVGFLVVTVIFALMFKVLPDVEIKWKSVWSGAIIAALLFTVGRFLLSWYFSEFKPTSAFGTAGTAILIMMWVNYSCLLLFFGAIFTRVYSDKKGWTILPSSHARWDKAQLYADRVAEQQKEKDEAKKEKEEAKKEEAKKETEEKSYSSFR